ncbi:unnamed protein product [Caenorhabditis sp. 36 PRJEB53466]|nr:unnamed protein product [Caenorhabditis sp. 36 PRJEB53466]
MAPAFLYESLTETFYKSCRGYRLFAQFLICNLQAGNTVSDDLMPNTLRRFEDTFEATTPIHLMKEHLLDLKTVSSVNYSQDRLFLTENAKRHLPVVLPIFTFTLESLKKKVDESRIEQGVVKMKTRGIFLLQSASSGAVCYFNLDDFRVGTMSEHLNMVYVEAAVATNNEKEQLSARAIEPFASSMFGSLTDPWSRLSDKSIGEPLKNH